MGRDFGADIFLAEGARVMKGVDKALKAKGQMMWIRRMNGIKGRAEEVVMRELVYQQ